MRTTKLTSREYKIMLLLWENDKPMYATEISNHIKKGLKPVYRSIDSLVDKGYIDYQGNESERLCKTAVDIKTYAEAKAAEVFGDPKIIKMLDTFCFRL